MRTRVIPCSQLLTQRSEQLDPWKILMHGCELLALYFPERFHPMAQQRATLQTLFAATWRFFHGMTALGLEVGCWEWEFLMDACGTDDEHTSATMTPQQIAEACDEFIFPLFHSPTLMPYGIATDPEIWNEGWQPLVAALHWCFHAQSWSTWTQPDYADDQWNHLPQIPHPIQLDAFATLLDAHPYPHPIFTEAPAWASFGLFMRFLERQTGFDILDISEDEAYEGGLGWQVAWFDPENVYAYIAQQALGAELNGMVHAFATVCLHTPQHLAAFCDHLVTIAAMLPHRPVSTTLVDIVNAPMEVPV